MMVFNFSKLMEIKPKETRTVRKAQERQRMAPPIPPGWYQAFQVLECSPSGRDHVDQSVGVTKKCAPGATESTPHSHAQDGSGGAGSRGAAALQRDAWIPAS